MRSINLSRRGYQSNLQILDPDVRIDSLPLEFLGRKVEFDGQHMSVPTHPIRVLIFIININTLKMSGVLVTFSSEGSSLEVIIPIWETLIFAEKALEKKFGEIDSEDSEHGEGFVFFYRKGNKPFTLQNNVRMDKLPLETHEIEKDGQKLYVPDRSIKFIYTYGDISSNDGYSSEE